MGGLKLLMQIGIVSLEDLGRSTHMIIKKASFFDMNEIVKMAFIYHKEDPRFQEILSNPVKSFLNRTVGPLYVWLTLKSFKAIVSNRIAGYILLKHRKFSIHIWDLVVHSEFRGKGIGTNLMKFTEEIAKNKYQYLTLAVLENNTRALRLYQKLGYNNFQFSPVCFRIKEFSPKMISGNTVRLESISRQKALSCRDVHFFDVVEAASGYEGREIVKLLYSPPSKLRGGGNHFRITSANDEVGYVSVRHKKDLTSIFFVLNPVSWGTYAEIKTVSTIIEHVSREFKGQIEMWVLEAYEKSLENSLKKIGIASDRLVPRLALVKKL